MLSARPAWVRRLIAFGAILALINAAVMVIVTRRIDPRWTGSGGTSLRAFTGSAYPPGRPFVPRARREGGTRTMHLIFPDGSEADLSYPAGLELAERGVTPVATSLVPNWQLPNYPIGFSFVSDPESHVADDLGLHTPSGVPIGRARTGGRGYAWHHLLFYELPEWSISVLFPAPMSLDQAVAHVDMHQTPEGFPVLELRKPVRFGEPMAMVIGGDYQAESRLPGTVTVQLVRGRCDHGLDFVRRTVARWCVGEPGAELVIEARGTAEFVRRVYDDVHASNIHPAP